MNRKHLTFYDKEVVLYSVAISSYKDESAQPVPSKAKESSSLLAMTLE